MSTPVTEIATINGNDVLKANPDLFDELTRFVHNKGAAGMQRQAWGRGFEDPGTWLWLVDWESLEHHKRARAGPPSNTGFKEKFASLVASPPMLVHVPFAPYDGFIKALAAPVTEVSSCRVKPETDSKLVPEILDSTLRGVEEHGGCIGWAWGRQVEDDNAIMVVIGWETIEAHEAYARTESFNTIAGAFRENFSDQKMSHFKFQEK